MDKEILLFFELLDDYQLEIMIEKMKELLQHRIE